MQWLHLIPCSPGLQTFQTTNNADVVLCVNISIILSLNAQFSSYFSQTQEELWYCMRKSGIVEKYVQLVQNMYEGSETVVRCAVGTTKSFKVKVGLHQGSALSPFLFAVIMDRLTDEVRREPPWTMLFADDIVICKETRKEVERRLESWRYALERRGMKVSRSKTEYLCINGGNDDETVKMEDTKVPRVKEFKYLGSTVQESGGCEREVKKREYRQDGTNGEEYQE